jgi:predicted NUDIX family phosphoesterase
MSQTYEEQILVVTAAVAEDAIKHIARNVMDLPSNDGFFPASSAVLSLLQESAFFVPRSPAESDPSLKQLIVYALVSYRGKILCYKRGKVGAETRLHAKRSIGVGGHINPEDWDLSASGIGAFEGALDRELFEEVGITSEYIDHVVFLGLVNEDSTEVGKVHLGLVYLVELDHVDGLSFENSLIDPQWMDESDILAVDTLEIWSDLARQVVYPVAPQVTASCLTPHQDRVVQEKDELDAKIAKLDSFIEGEVYGRLQAEEQSRLNRQRLYMSQYSDVLTERIAAF